MENNESENLVAGGSDSLDAIGEGHAYKAGRNEYQEAELTTAGPSIPQGTH